MAGKVVCERGVNVHNVLAVFDCVACVNKFVAIVSPVVLLVRHETKRLQGKAVE